jgi:hypothetical protein
MCAGYAGGVTAENWDLEGVTLAPEVSRMPTENILPEAEIIYYPCPVCDLVVTRNGDGWLNGRFDRSIGRHVCDNGHEFWGWSRAKPATGICVECGDIVTLEWPVRDCPRGHAATSVFGYSRPDYIRYGRYDTWGHPWDYSDQSIGELRRIGSKWKVFTNADLVRIRQDALDYASEQEREQRARGEHTPSMVGDRYVWSIMCGVVAATLAVILVAPYAQEITPLFGFLGFAGGFWLAGNLLGIWNKL